MAPLHALRGRTAFVVRSPVVLADDDQALPIVPASTGSATIMATILRRSSSDPPNWSSNGHLLLQQPKSPLPPLNPIFPLTPAKNFCFVVLISEITCVALSLTLDLYQARAMRLVVGLSGDQYRLEVLRTTFSISYELVSITFGLLRLAIQDNKGKAQTPFFHFLYLVVAASSAPPPLSLPALSAFPKIAWISFFDLSLVLLVEAAISSFNFF